MPRDFRTPESYQAEKITRAMLVSFLEERGFTGVTDQRRKYGQNESQTIHAVAPSGRDVAMRVKLCWRRGREGKAETYSATQLLANVKDGAWEKALNAYSNKLRKEGATDLLVVQRDGSRIVHAALIGVESLTDIWTAQRDESAKLIQAKAMGNRKKNHAENGGSPTLWLQDDLALSVPQKLWQHSGVTNLMTVPDGKPVTLAEIIQESLSYLQGMTSQVTQEIKARCDALRKRTKELLRDSDGLLRCKVCDWHKPAHEMISGDIVELHHLDPISQAPDQGRIVTIDDAATLFVPVCPNCHRMIHVRAGGGQLDVETLRGILQK